MDKKKELTEFERVAKDRINHLINTYCGGSQQRFAEKTGLSKASVSQYAHGKNVPSNITAGKIAEVFHVDPAWIMGFDLPTPYDEALAMLNCEPDIVVAALSLYSEFQKLTPENQIAFRTLLKNLQSDS